MDYYIIPESEVNCQHEFPESLSFFFEQVGGYEEYAEVSQVSKILQIDLSVFQEISYDDDGSYDGPVEEDESPEDLSTIWHDTATVIQVIDNLLAKIGAFPDYYKQVLHNPNRKQDLNSLFQLTASGDEEGMRKGLEALESKPLFGYPTDYGYLSRGELVEDLKVLRETLMCYEDNGVSRFKFRYM